MNWTIVYGMVAVFAVLVYIGVMIDRLRARASRATKRLDEIELKQKQDHCKHEYPVSDYWTQESGNKKWIRISGYCHKCNKYKVLSDFSPETLRAAKRIRKVLENG